MTDSMPQQTPRSDNQSYQDLQSQETAATSKRTQQQLEGSHISAAGASSSLNFEVPIYQTTADDASEKSVPVTSTKKCRGDKVKPTPAFTKGLEKGEGEVVMSSKSGKEQEKKKKQKNEAGGKESIKPELRAIPQTNFAIGLMVLCCFNLPFGVVALYFSLRAAAAYRDGNKEKGLSNSRISIILSLIGIMLTMVIVSSVVVYIAEAKHSKRSSREPNSSALGL